MKADTIEAIATALGEAADGPRRRIAEIIDDLGEEQSLGLLQETKRIEEAGGQMLPNGKRRRTPGGVFFSLAKGVLRERKQKEADEVAAREPDASAGGPERPRRRLVEVSAIARPVARSYGGPKTAAKPALRVAPQVPPRHQGSSDPATMPVQSSSESPQPLVAVRVVRKPEAAPPPPPKPVVPRRRIVTPLRRDLDDLQPLAVLRQRLRSAIEGFEPDVTRRALADVLSDLYAQHGGPPLEGELSGLEVEEAAPSSSEQDVAVASAAREKVLCAVADALGLAPADLAPVLSGTSDSAAIRQASAALKRYRAEHGDS